MRIDPLAHSPISSPEAQPACGAAEVPRAPDGTPPTLAWVKHMHIQRVLADTSGNVSEAARRLGIHRRSLQRMLQKPAPRA